MAARYGQIRQFERLVAEEGTAIVKLFLHISADEQRQRLQDRIDSPTSVGSSASATSTTAPAGTTSWPPSTTRCARTSTDAAPWYVVPADRKWVRNLAVAQILRHHLERLDPQYPEPEEGIEGLVVT